MPRQMEQSVELLAYTPDPEKLIELAGRTCYKSEDRITDESAAKFIRMILKRGHETVVEHASATFKIVCDRGITHEIVRHRVASYSQESTRYCNYGKGEGQINLIVNVPGAEDFEGYEEDMLELAAQCEETYNKLIAKGVSPQFARRALPIGLKTEIVMTANFREWRHFIKMRADTVAHPSIREIARRIAATLYEIAPSVFEDLTWQIHDGAKMGPNYTYKMPSQ